MTIYWGLSTFKFKTYNTNHCKLRSGCWIFQIFTEYYAENHTNDITCF